MDGKSLVLRAGWVLAGISSCLLAVSLASWAVAQNTGAAPAAARARAVEAPEGWKPVWGDEFDGAEIDRKKWDFDVGNRLPSGQPGWGNDELQFYTARAENARVKDGMLHIRAAREPYEGAAFTSARLKTRGLFAKQFGRFEIRAKLPTGKGVWPAIWMLPQDSKYGGWAASGEIDIMEARGQEPGKVLGTLHYGSSWPANLHTGKDYILPDGGTIADFHEYAIEWEPGEIRWFVDGELYQTQDFWWSSSARKSADGVPPADESALNPWPAPFDQPFFLLLNVAVGGRFLGNPDPDTAFPVEMLIDYVRVCDRAAGYNPAKPRGAGKLPFARP